LTETAGFDSCRRELDVADPTGIPYTLHVQTVQTDNCEWVYRVEYVEIDGCVTEGPDLLRALSRLEELRDEHDTGKWRPQ
jgi:hypothetical protein